MKLRNALEEKKFDTRLMDRHVADGKVKASEVKDFVNKLEDNEGKYENTIVGEKETQTQN